MTDIAAVLVSEMLDVDDIDDPKKFISSQPVFRFVHSSYEGDQVWVERGLGKGKGFWPLDIGNVAQHPEGGWFVIHARGLLNKEHNFGSQGQRFATKEQAALAIWTKQHLRKGNLADANHVLRKYETRPKS